MRLPFHLAFGVRDLESTRAFYGGALGCPMGRASETWQDFDFFGHQLSAHVSPKAEASSGEVDGADVPIPHFGIVLDLLEWRALADRLADGGIAFLVAPHVRFEGQPGEQGTFFLQDPSLNTLEFKGIDSPSGLFAAGSAAESEDVCLKRLRMRAWRRGMREMDLILGRFADTHLAGLDPQTRDAFEALLAENDQDLYEWVNGQRPIPQNYSDILQSVRAACGFS